MLVRRSILRPHWAPAYAGVTDGGARFWLVAVTYGKSVGDEL